MSPEQAAGRAFARLLVELLRYDAEVRDGRMSRQEADRRLTALVREHGEAGRDAWRARLAPVLGEIERRLDGDPPDRA